MSETDDIQNGFEHHTILIIYKNGVKPKVNSMMRAIAQLILLEIKDSQLDCTPTLAKSESGRLI